MAVHDLKITPTPQNVRSLDSDRKIYTRDRVYNLCTLEKRSDKLLFAADFKRVLQDRFDLHFNTKWGQGPATTEDVVL